MCARSQARTHPRVWDKQVGKGFARVTLQKTSHQQYLDMYQERVATNVINRRIASKLHQVFLIITLNLTNVDILLFILRYTRWLSKSAVSLFKKTSVFFE